MSEGLTLQLSRVVKTTRKRAFAAWTTPEQLLLWFSPGTLKVESAEVQPRAGGTIRMVWVGLSPQTGAEMRVQVSGVFLGFIADELLRFNWRVEGDTGEDTLVTVEFKDVELGTEVVLTQKRISTEALWNRNRSGWGVCLDKLAALCQDDLVAIAE